MTCRRPRGSPLNRPERPVPALRKVSKLCSLKGHALPDETNRKTRTTIIHVRQFIIFCATFPGIVPGRQQRPAFVGIRIRNVGSRLNYFRLIAV